MEFSLFLAKAWGLYFLLISLAFLIRRENLQTILRLSKNEEFILLSGILALIIGILSILSHNIWTFDFRGLITLLGWAALIKGLLRLISPGTTISFANKFKDGKNITFVAIIVLLLGIYLAYAGFSA